MRRPSTSRSSVPANRIAAEHPIAREARARHDPRPHLVHQVEGHASRSAPGSTTTPYRASAPGALPPLWSSAAMKPLPDRIRRSCRSFMRHTTAAISSAQSWTSSQSRKSPSGAWTPAATSRSSGPRSFAIESAGEDVVRSCAGAFDQVCDDIGLDPCVDALDVGSASSPKRPAAEQPHRSRHQLRCVHVDEALRRLEPLPVVHATADRRTASASSSSQSSGDTTVTLAPCVTSAAPARRRSHVSPRVAIRRRSRDGHGHRSCVHVTARSGDGQSRSARGRDERPLSGRRRRDWVGDERRRGPADDHEITRPGTHDRRRRRARDRRVDRGSRQDVRADRRRSTDSISRSNAARSTASSDPTAPARR